jgi:hypothetical protein
MLNENAIQIISTQTAIENDQLVITISIKNPLPRTVYAYGKPRRIFYDNNSGKLTLFFHDHMNSDEEKVYSPHLKEPHFVQLEGKTVTELKVKLDKKINRIRSGAERGNGPLFEELRVSEAKEVHIEIVHQDTPFYYNPKLPNAKQLNEWGKNISKANFKIRQVKE